MNSTKFEDSFDHLYPTLLSSVSQTNTREILVIIGLITICFLLFILLIQCFLKLRDLYRTSEPKKRYKKSSRYPSYQKLLITDNKTCKCFQYSCLPKFQCIKTSCQIKTIPIPYYEQIDERQLNNSISQIFPSNNTSSIRVHIIK